MIPTWIGALLLVVGIPIVLRQSLNAALLLIFIASLFGGSAALQLPALGGSSIPPAYVALGLAGLQMLMRERGFLITLGHALRENAALAFFCIYGFATAFILPHLFAGAFNVVPMQAKHPRWLFETLPLHFTSQNITTAVYMIGTLVAAIYGWTAGRRAEPGRFDLINIILITTWLDIIFAVIVFALTMVGQTALVEIVRNGAYAQLTNDYGGFSRITGFFPEASSFAAFSTPLLYVLTEAWLRDLKPRWTGPATVALLIVLMASTSSSAYVSIGALALILFLRVLLFPNSLPPGKLARIVLFGLIAAALGIIAAALSPKAFDAVSDMLRHMTVEKATSASGMQRKFWAQQGLIAFAASHGLGIGAGSFRSSSLSTAILGSCGIIGLAAFTIYVVQFLRPLRASTYGASRAITSEHQLMGICAAWGAVGILVPEQVGAPSPDPGLLFGVFAGFAIAARSGNFVGGAPQPAAATYGTSPVGMPLPQRRVNVGYLGPQDSRS